MRKPNRMRFLVTTLGAALLALAWASPSQALTFTGSSGTLSAAVDFELSGTTLTVSVQNTSLTDVLDQAQMLSAVFWCGNGTLTPVSALLGAGAVVQYATVNGSTAPTGGNVGGEYAYAAAALPGGATNGISASGFGVFGNGNFNGPDLSPPAAVNGFNYAITSAGDNITTGNNPVTGVGGGANPYVQNTNPAGFAVVFTLTGFTGTLADISCVSFQYGTALTDTNIPGIPSGVVPEPSSLAIAGLGALGLFGYGLRRRRTK